MFSYADSAAIHSGKKKSRSVMHELWLALLLIGSCACVCHKKGGWVPVGGRIYFNRVKPSQFGGCKSRGSRRVFPVFFRGISAAITSGKNNNPAKINRCGFYHRRNCANKFYFITEPPRHKVKRK